ncbi:MAG TPA: glycoside hydrolase family 97 N-terminal domain-containing protein [Parapedobacter sp.]|uniref:glycoside hydrolase family 97 protein n=1 Tax=Parapedobacter sp. TaxID=1958893 RepID=UPI002B9A95F9|nr:glycoside hydrolase family 97 N-terminal domain-containing protein [Parapedobacter sp.]HWK57642.1 glycoside hydrolase family 97 N-terminal domain-containing protein [Parapedobacter sp.]
MKNIRYLSFLILILFQVNLSANEVVHSPDGKIDFKISVVENGIKYSVSFLKQPVIETSPMHMILDGKDLCAHAELGSAEKYSVDEKYPTRGVHSLAINKCNGVKIPIIAENNTKYFIEVRTYNDGVAFRFIIPGDHQRRIPDEATVFNLPASSTVWYHDFYWHYEGVHLKKHISAVAEGEWGAPPLTFKLASGHYAAINEADLRNYAGMSLQADGNGGFVTRLGHIQPSSYPFAHDYTLQDAIRLSEIAAIQGDITTPWRTVTIGTDLNTMVNSDLLTNLCPPPNEALFPDGIETDWIKPGRSVWAWLDGGDRTIEGMKMFSKLAGELGFEYNTVDAFWGRWTDAEIKDLVDYSAKYGVKIWLWRHGRDIQNNEERRAFFKRCRDLGVVGVKLDAFSNESKEFIDLYQDCLKDAAEFKLMVNFHGNNKPSGESRTWPNEMTREGIRGLEYGKNQGAWATHNVTLPFTRLLAGHGDYTPMVFGERRLETTWVHQVATAIVFTSPVLIFGANPHSLLENPAVNVIKDIHGSWDETYVLPNSEIGELAAFARRKGDTWFLAILNGDAAKRFQVPLTFLEEGNWYEGTVLSDRASNPASIKIDKVFSRSTDDIPVHLNAAGGFVVRFKKVKQ